MLYKDKIAVGDFSALLKSYSVHELRSATRSTVPLLAYWHSHVEQVPSLLSQLGMPADSVELHFEFSVDSATIAHTKRLNTASQTDLMIHTPGVAVALEGKWTENAYDSTRKWLGETPTENKSAVLDHWLKIIGRLIGRSLIYKDFYDVPNQMIHRAASACHSDAIRTAMVYQCFQSPDHAYHSPENDLRHFHAQLGNPKSFPFFLYHCPMEPTEHFRQIIKSFVPDTPELAQAIREGINDGNLFDFKPAKLARID